MELQNQPRQPKFFYGWVVVFSILCLQGAAVGVIGNTMTIFIRPVSEDLGVTRSVFYLYNTFGMIAGLCMGPVWGEFFRNRRFKPYMIVGSMFAGGAIFAYSFATHVYQFYAIAMVKSAFQGMLTGVPIARTLSFWFIEKRGFATGISLAGSGLAGSIMTPIVSKTIQNYGWRAGYRQLGILFFLITVPVLLFLYRERPEDMGLKPLGWESQPQRPQSGETGLKSGFTRAQAFRSKTFWYYAAALFLVQGCTMSTASNVVNHLTDIGYTPAAAASIFSLVLFMLVPGKPILGYVYDKLGMKAGTILITSMLAVSPALLAFTGTLRNVSWMPYAFALWFGLAYSIATMQLPYMTPRLFGDKEFTRVYGVCQPFTSLGSALMLPIVNRIQESTGSYVPIFFALTGIVAVSLALMLAAIKLAPVERERFDREDGILTEAPPTPIAAS